MSISFAHMNGGENIPLVSQLDSPLNQRVTQKVTADLDTVKQQKYGTQWESVLYHRDNVYILSGNYDSPVAFDGFISKMDLNAALICNYEMEKDTSLNRNVVVSDNRAIKGGWIEQGAGSEMVVSKDGNITIGLDRGTVVTYDPDLKQQVSSLSPHSSVITGLLSSADGILITSCSYDKSIVQVDLEATSIKASISPAHGAPITAIAPDPENESNVFVTGAKDKQIVGWDLREHYGRKKFATLASIPSAIYWSTSNTNYIYVGTYNSSVVLFDRRSADAQVAELASRQMDVNEIHRIKPLHNKQLAIVSKHPVLNVLKEESLEPVYQGSNYHEKWIRDVVQIDSKVYSIGMQCYHLVEHHIQ